MPTKLGFLGCGHMARAIIDGLLADEQHTYSPAQILATCRSAESAEAICAQTGINCRTDNRWLVEQADVLILAVKPQHMQGILEEISPLDLRDKLIVTLAAGIDSASYRKYLDDEQPLVRAMPNIAAEIGAGLTGLYSDRALNDAATQRIETLFGTVGDIAWLDDEIQLDGVMALSGSGIAYFFRFMQAMAEAGEQYGFTRDEVYDLVSLTALGAASLALERSDAADFAALCRSVAVEGGTTAKAIAVLTENGLDRTTATAMDAVVKRAAELQQTLTQDW